jgi:hypothetical protein
MCKSSQTLIEGLAPNTHYPVGQRDTWGEPFVVRASRHRSAWLKRLHIALTGLSAS